MKALIVACISAVVVGGCVSGHFGARGGAVVVLARGSESGPVTNSTSGVGGVYGVTFGGRFSEKAGLQTDIMVRSASILQEVDATFRNGDNYFRFDGTIDASATVVEVPLLLTLSKPINEHLTPILGIGGHMGFRTSTSSTIAGTLTQVDGEGAGNSAAVSKKSSGGTSEDPLAGLSALVGLDYKLSEDWSIRGEMRFQHDFVNTRLSSYSIGDSYLSPDVTAYLPQTRLTLALALLFRL
ncbi:MAG: hypothetical protein SGJ05_06525 [bacterium]|nr:hypothetical protein [bacterium]